jgi:hypothetical protein
MQRYCTQPVIIYKRPQAGEKFDIFALKNAELRRI